MSCSFQPLLVSENTFPAWYNDDYNEPIPWYAKVSLRICTDDPVVYYYTASAWGDSGIKPLLDLSESTVYIEGRPVDKQSILTGWLSLNTGQYVEITVHQSTDRYCYYLFDSKTWSTHGKDIQHTLSSTAQSFHYGNEVSVLNWSELEELSDYDDDEDEEKYSTAIKPW